MVMHIGCPISREQLDVSLHQKSGTPRLENRRISSIPRGNVVFDGPLELDEQSNQAAPSNLDQIVTLQHRGRGLEQSISLETSRYHRPMQRSKQTQHSGSATGCPFEHRGESTTLPLIQIGLEVV